MNNYKEEISISSDWNRFYRVLSETWKSIGKLIIPQDINNPRLSVCVVDSDRTNIDTLVILLEKFIEYMNKQGHENFRLLVGWLNSWTANALIERMKRDSYIDSWSYLVEKKLTVIVCWDN